MKGKTFKYVLYVTMAHCLTYFICGVIFSAVMRYNWWWQQPVMSDYFRSFSGPASALGPLLQIVRGHLFALILIPIKDFLKEQKLGWLWLWLLFLGIGIWGAPAAAPASIEGMIYSKLPLPFHFVGMPEVCSQTLLFSILVHRYLRKADNANKKSMLKIPVVRSLGIAVAAFFIYTIISIVFAVIQHVEINEEQSSFKNMMQFFSPVLIVFVISLIRNSKPVLMTVILYLLSVLSFFLYQNFVLNDINLIYDFIAPVLPALLHLLLTLKKVKKEAAVKEELDSSEKN